MVARSFQVHHNDSTFAVDYDTSDGLEVFKFQLFSLTAISPDEQKLIGADDNRVVADDFDLVDISEKLRLVSINEEQQEESNAPNDELLKSDEELARMLQAEEEALLFQQFSAPNDNGQFDAKVRPYVKQVLMYEDPERQEAARKTVPVEELEEKALLSLAKEGNLTPSKDEQDHAFLLQLLFWFKQSFRWVNAPPCESCGKETECHGMAEALPLEVKYGASRVEIYGCKSCLRVTRFPRYNDPLKLVETRKGRCGEWANCFTLYCRTFGYESRLILDFTDHVWTECFSQSLGRWMHLDPCEGVYDKPLLYESGWNKKLDYVIAISKVGVCDATKRYTKKWHEVLSRRNLITEPALSAVLANITKDCRRGFTSQVLSVLEDRDVKERKELESGLHSTDDAATSLPGRRSGDKEWRKSRLESGSDESCSLSGSSCPLRACMDEHVTKIQTAILRILTEFVKEELPKSRAVEVLEAFKEIIRDLKMSPFRTRRATADSVLVHQFLPSFTELLNAISMSGKADADGRVDISLAGDAVQTSLALPVALDALDDTIDKLNSCNSYFEDSLGLPVLKLNRIHSGSVLASGEEIPFGIATSAFDGTRASKWEEPNGAKGCWIMYKDNQMHELVAYEFMSAEDAPERDPMDWVVEGSNDGGSSWHLLDEQTCQKFHSRFQRKTFKISSQAFLSNAFRFRFSAVLNAKSNSRLQLGSIDLYSKSS